MKNRELKQTTKQLLILFLVSFYSSVVFPQKLYTPKEGNPMLESWRWTPFYELVGKSARCVTETSDGNMMFGINRGVIIYDGENWIEQNQENGFVDYPVIHLINSDDGLIYAGTTEGIYEFDGIDWRKIFPKNNIEKGNESFAIRSLNKINGGGISVSFNNGVLLYEEGKYTILASENSIVKWPQTEGVNFLTIPDDKCIDSVFYVEEVFHDSKGRFWTAINKVQQKGKVFYFTLDKNGEIEYSKIFSSSDGVISGRDIQFEEDENGSIWVINSNIGINVFDGKTWKFIQLAGENSFQSISNVDGDIWIGGFGFLYSYKDDQWSLYKKPSTNIPNLKIDIYNDSKGYLWIIGVEGEVIRIDYSDTRWNSLKGLNFQCEDNNNNLWFISVDGKVVVKNRDQWYYYETKDGLPDAPVNITCTKSGLICVSGSLREVSCVSFFDGFKWDRQLFPELSWGVDFRVVYEDNEQNLWIGGSVNPSFINGQKGGIVKIANPGENNEQITHYLSDDGIHMSSAYGIVQAKDGVIWLGGAFLSTFKNNTWQPYTTDRNIRRIDCMGSTRNGALWVGTRTTGIYRYENNTWDEFNIENGLISNSILSILPIKENQLWIATDKDFSRFDGKSWTTEIFHEELTISREGGNLRKQKDGTLWINRSSRAWQRRALSNNTVTNEDYSYFSAISYNSNKHVPNTKILVYSEEVSSEGNTYIEWTGNDKWKETPSSKLQYAYRLNNGEWSNFSKKSNVTLLNLKNGDYTFEVKARDVDFNTDPTPAKISFRVAPPVWKQPWFIVLISSLLVVIIYYQYITYNQNRNLEKLNKNLGKLNKDLARHSHEIERKNILLEKQKEQILFQNIQENENHQSKLRFFTNVSHEFRTPLTLITGILEGISEKSIKKNPSQFINNLSIIKYNAKRLLHLINQLMDFRKLENNVMGLYLSETEINSFVQDICHSLKPIAEKYKIELSYKSDFKKLNGWIDGDKIQKILFNLLSNALKVTSSPGRIELRLRKIKKGDATFIEITVEDTGNGIPENETKKIFERFYQTENAIERNYVGTGIGLSIVNNYINLHKGTIEVESSTDKEIQAKRGYSTRFLITIPIDNSAYTDYTEKSFDKPFKNNMQDALSIFETEIDKGGNTTDSVNVNSNKSLPSVLVVEDNSDLRRFISASLKDHFQIIEAENGKDGFDACLAHMPDTIISDVMMPEMSGTELCEKIKGDIRTSHIPIILLTALTTDENKIEGYKFGADDYVTKPFSFSVLVARINNILAIRENLKRKFRNEEVIFPEEVEMLSMDTDFLQNVKSIVEKNYSNSEFNVLELSKQVGLSKRHFLHKLKSLVDITPVEYIKVFRLKKAAQLLSAKKATISEIAYDTGFSELSYFGKCFAKYYKMSPSEYIKKYYVADKNENDV